MNLTSRETSTPQTAAGKSSFSNWWLLTAAIPILAAIAISIPIAFKQEAQKGFFGTRMFPLKSAYDFKLNGSNSEQARLDQLHGKVVLFIFGFTHCANVCPTSLTNLAAVYQALRSPSWIRPYPR
jgi:cytochrome oxidase Cu insertion factor (SCO1/SenC/PrrC family)